MINDIGYDALKNEYFIENWDGSRTRYTAEYVKALREDEKKRVPKMIDVTKRIVDMDLITMPYEEFTVETKYESGNQLAEAIKMATDKMTQASLYSNTIYTQNSNSSYPTAPQPYVNNGYVNNGLVGRNPAAGQATGGWVNPEPPSMPATTADLQAMKEEIIQEVCVFLENWLNEQTRDR